jgi:hypothetical protein
MFYAGDYPGIITLGDGEGTSARIITERLVVRIFRHGTGNWQLGSVKIVGAGDTVINPGWKTNQPTERPPDYSEEDDARMFAETCDSITEAVHLLGLTKSSGGDDDS